MLLCLICSIIISTKGTKETNNRTPRTTQANEDIGKPIRLIEKF
nr:MAG TPA: hypothetical protein [Caudoviricetes sp.]